MDIKNLVNYCDETLDLENTILSDEYYYSNLPLCVIDSVFSIGIRYSTIQKIVERFCNFIQIEKTRKNKNIFPSQKSQLSITELIELYKENGVEYFTNIIYDNRNRTSSVNGILKSEAVWKFLKVLQKYNINYLQDVNKSLLFNKDFEAEIKDIKGQGSGISLRYFFMLVGNENSITPDRMIERFVKNAIGRKVSTKEILQLLDEALILLNKEYPNLTLRELDHEIWKYQKEV